MTLPLSRFITTQSQLEELARELEGSSMLAIDTEFMREKTYYAKLCLLQLNNGTVSAIVDPARGHGSLAARPRSHRRELREDIPCGHAGYRDPAS